MGCKYNVSNWDGILPRRRYARVYDLISGYHIIVVYEDDIERAEQWSSFVQWFGPERPAETRNVKFNCEKNCGCM